MFTVDKNKWGVHVVGETWVDYSIPVCIIKYSPKKHLQGVSILAHSLRGQYIMVGET